MGTLIRGGSPFFDLFVLDHLATVLTQAAKCVALVVLCCFVIPLLIGAIVELLIFVPLLKWDLQINQTPIIDLGSGYAFGIFFLQPGFVVAGEVVFRDQVQQVCFKAVI